MSGTIGTSGNDTLSAVGSASYQGFGGNDWIQQDSAAADTINGGDGLDVVFYESATGPVVIDLAAGTASGPGTPADTLIGIENVHGSQFADSISGSDLNGYVFGRAGNDTLRGLAGNDVLQGGSGNDLIDGGAGTGDEAGFIDGFDPGGPIGQGAIVNLGAAVFAGVAGGTARDGWGGTDTLVGIEHSGGTHLADSLMGSAEANRLSGSAGNDLLIGGEGNDTLNGDDGDDSLAGGDGRDNLNGGLGNDTLDASGGSGSTQGNGDFVSPGAGQNTIIGHAGLWALNEGIDLSYRSVTGTGGIVVTVGANGTGTAASNTAGVVNDTFTFTHYFEGTQAGDRFTGSGNLIFEGFVGSGGADTIDGAGGFDEILYNQDSLAGGTAGVTVNFATGSAVDGFGATDIFFNIEGVRGTNQADLLIGAAGLASVRLRGLGGADTLQGTTSIDHASYNQDAANGGLAGIVADLAAGTIQDGFGSIDIVSSIDQVTGTAVGDRMTAGAAGVRFSGEGGADTLTGGVGNDSLIGGAGADTLRGLDGNDELTGGSGNDLLEGGTGFDFTWYGDATGPVVVDFAAGTATGDGVDTLTGIEGMAGSQFADTLLGAGTDDYFRGDAVSAGGGAADHIDGRGGTDRIDYRDDPAAVLVNLGTGRATDGRGFQDTILGFENASGGAFGDTLIGTEAGNNLVGRGGNDVILGGAAGGIDTLAGDDGDDILSVLGTGILTGGAGADTLTGGAGNDTLTGGAGNDLLSGGPGINEAVFSGNRADYLVTSLANGQALRVQDLRSLSPDGTDTLAGMQSLRFADGVVAAETPGTSLAITTLVVERPEGNGSGVTVFEYTVTRSGDLSGTSAVDWSVAGGGAPSGGGTANAADFQNGVLPAGTIGFAAGQATATVKVRATRDTADEADDYFILTLSSPTAATIASGTALGVIRNDDARVTYSITPVSADLAEGNGSGVTVFEYAVTRGGDLGLASQVGFTVAGSGANAANAADFQNGALPAGSVSFAAGQATATLKVRVARDAVVEADEGFTISLAAPASGTATGIIRNDDASLTYSIAGLATNLAEGNGSGVTVFEYAVTRGGDLGLASQVGFTVAGSGANAANAADFQNGVLPAGTVSFAAGQATATLKVRAARDAAVEADEGFTVALVPPASGSLGIGSATGVIRNDDASLAYSIAGVSSSLSEGNGSGVTVFEYAVTRGGDLGLASQVGFAVAGSGANAANAADFQNGVLPAGSVSFAAGQATATLKVRVARDAVVEADEGFTVSLAAPASGTATGTIRNDDASVTYAFAPGPGSVAEGNGTGVTVIQFQVNRSGDTSVASQATFAVGGSGADPANAADFINGVLPSGSVDFAAGATSAILKVRVQRDAIAEADEAFLVSLSSNGSLVGSAAATIMDDDTPISSSFAPQGTELLLLG